MTDTSNSGIICEATRKPRAFFYSHRACFMAAHATQADWASEKVDYREVAAQELLNKATTCVYCHESLLSHLHNECF